MFTLGHLRNRGTGKIFPITGNNGEVVAKLQELTQGVSDALRVYRPEGLGRTLKAEGGGWGAKTGLYSVMDCLTPDRLEKRQNGRRFKENGEPMFTLTKQDIHGVMFQQVQDAVKKTRPNEEIGITFKENGDIRPHRMDAKKSGLSELAINNEKNIANTITAAHMPKIYGDSTINRIRKLTPKECWRLQGVSDEITDKVIAGGVSDSQMYRGAGDACTTNVIYEIAKKLT